MDIHFDWRVALHRSDREALRKNILERLHDRGEIGRAARVIVSPVRFDPYDERVVVEIRSTSGEVLSSDQHIELNKLQIPENGTVLSDHSNARFASPNLQLSMI